MMSVFVLPVTLQQYSSISTSSSDILIRVSCRFGLSVGLPVLGAICLPPFFWLHIYYNLCVTKSQEVSRNILNYFFGHSHPQSAVCLLLSSTGSSRRSSTSFVTVPLPPRL